MNRIFTLIFLLAVLWPLPTWAAFQIEPRLLVREEFTDNLFLDADDEKSDFITTVAPGILLQYDARLLELELDYSLQFLKYLHHDERDETSLSDTQRVRFRGVLLPEKDFSLTVLDDYERVTIDDRRQVVDDNPFINKSNRNRLVVNPEYRSGYFRTFTPIAGYRFEKLDYDDPEGDDSDLHEFYADLEKQFSPRLTATLGYRYSLYEADQAEGQVDEDYKRQDLTARGDYRLSNSITLRAGAGSAWIDYKERSDEQAVTWDLGLDWLPEARWQAGLAYKEDFAVSVNDGLSKNRRAEAYIAYLERLPWELRAYAEKRDYRTEEREDRSAGLNAKLSLPISTRFTLNFTGEGSLWRFLPEDEDVVRYGAGLALNYEFKYGLATAGYRYRESDSDVEENDYVSNLGYVQLSLRF